MYGSCNSLICLGHFENVYDDDDDVQCADSRRRRRRRRRWSTACRRTLPVPALTDLDRRPLRPSRQP